VTKTPSVISPWRVLLPISLGTALSLLGDASLYAVLPTHMAEAGVTLAGVGILLSANRWIRLALNGPIGVLYDRTPRRHLFVPALFIGALSTALYALTQGLWPLLLARLLWGLAWVGIWIGGNTIILDISHPNNRGRWIGVYQISFFLGTSVGAMLGGFLTDWLGYHPAMGISALLTLTGAVIALLFLPETQGLKAEVVKPKGSSSTAPTVAPTAWAELASAMSLLGVHRLVGAGILSATFGLFLKEQFGESISIAHLSVGVATLTGVGLGLHGLVSMSAAPLMGNFSDYSHSRWQTAAAGLLPGIAGFGLLIVGTPLAILLAMPLIAITGGSNQSLATALVGDLSTEQQRGQRLGFLFTIGDLTSAVGPLLAYALIPSIGVGGLYLLSAGLVGIMFLVTARWAIKVRKRGAIQV
jgi:MFS family permease